MFVYCCSTLFSLSFVSLYSANCIVIVNVFLCLCVSFDGLTSCFGFMADSRRFVLFTFECMGVYFGFYCLFHSRSPSYSFWLPYEFPSYSFSLSIKYTQAHTHCMYVNSYSSSINFFFSYLCDTINEYHHHSNDQRINRPKNEKNCTFIFLWHLTNERVCTSVQEYVCALSVCK